MEEPHKTTDLFAVDRKLVLFVPTLKCKQTRRAAFRWTCDVLLLRQHIAVGASQFSFVIAIQTIPYEVASHQLFSFFEDYFRIGFR